MMRNFRLLFCILAVAVTMLNSCGKGEDAPPPTDPTTTNPDSDSDSDPTTTKYTITFDANGGSVSPASAETDDKGKIESLPTPSFDSFAFEGWFTESTGGDKINVNTTYTKNTTIYAQWGEPRFTITLDANGGEVSPAKVAANEKGLVASLPTPTLDGFAFDGWFTESTGGDRLTTETVFTDNITIYAQWKKSKFTITLDVAANGGEVSYLTAETNNEGMVTDLPEPTNGDREFKGWYTAATGGEEVLVETVLDADITIYAQWYYIISFDANGGNDDLFPFLLADKNNRLVELQEATYDGCEFAGWFTAPTGGEKVTLETVFDADATIYAQWIGLHIITFDGDVGTPSVASMYADLNGKIDPSQVSATRAGCNFEGWYTQKNGAGEKITADMLFAGNATVYAHWSIKFGDDKLRTWVLGDYPNTDSDNDGKISPTEALTLLKLDGGAPNGITSLVGIEFFSNITLFRISNVLNITEINLEENTKLEEIMVMNTNVNTFTLPRGGSILKTLNCSNNKLTNLDLARCFNLISLNCEQNELSGEFDISSMLDIKVLNISENDITSIKFNRYVSVLHTLHCYDNKISNLDISGTDILGNESAIRFGNQRVAGWLNLTVTAEQKANLEVNMNKPGNIDYNAFVNLVEK